MASTVYGRHPASSFHKEVLRIRISTENGLLCSSEITREIEKGFAVYFAKLHLFARVFRAMQRQLHLSLFLQTGLQLCIFEEGYACYVAWKSFEVSVWLPRNNLKHCSCSVCLWDMAASDIWN
ncbi:hypothetical protein CDL15_Pgr016736 [Punica granatum]|uniref:Uncharacterized protein n=1 Tax=Punica granatum TaxID=22663 RepID=A0A218WXT9_PUNGR|nr:hypothetical protein CDL15_Pgr016736 [Punica granatum]